MDFVGFLSMIIYEVLYTWCLRYNICSAWLLDIRISTCFWSHISLVYRPIELLFVLSFSAFEWLHSDIPYSGKFLRTINFAIFMDFTSTMKIISLKFLLEQAACLCDQIDCFTHVLTWYVVVQVLCSKMQGSPPNCSCTVGFVIVIILSLSSSCHCCSQWRNH